MDVSDILRFRLATFQRNFVDDLIPLDLLRSQTANGAIGEAINGVAATMTAVYDWSRMGLEAPARRQPYEFLGWRLQHRLLRFADDVRLLRLGMVQGYYPPNSGEVVAETILRSSFGLFDLEPLVSQIFTFAMRWDEDTDLRSVPGAVRSTLPEVFVDVLAAAWQDSAHKAFSDCVELLLFAGSKRWDERSGRLADLSRRLADNPSLSLTPNEADDLEWGLSGAEPIFDDSGEDIQWSITCQAARASVAAESGSRAENLAQIRGDIAHAARLITTDERVAADRRLEQALGSTLRFRRQ